MTRGTRGERERAVWASTTPDDRRYSIDHMWLDPAGRIGITHRLAQWLPPLKALHLPSVAHRTRAAQSFCLVEADKGVFDLYAPCDGVTLEVNTALSSAPDLPRLAPYGDGWLVRIDHRKTILLSAADYDRARGSMLPPFRGIHEG